MFHFGFSQQAQDRRESSRCCRPLIQIQFDTSKSLNTFPFWLDNRCWHSGKSCSQFWHSNAAGYWSEFFRLDNQSKQFLMAEKVSSRVVLAINTFFFLFTHKTLAGIQKLHGKCMRSNRCVAGGKELLLWTGNTEVLFKVSSLSI